MKSRFSVLVLIVLWSMTLHLNARAQSCLTLDTVLVNRDSTYIDTCSASSTYGEFFCRRRYRLQFNSYVISAPVFSFDTALTFEWHAIDSSYDSIRRSFQALETKIGHFVLIKDVAYIADTGSEFNRVYYLRFDSLLCVDTALAMLSTVPELWVSWEGQPTSRLYTADKGMIPGLDFGQLTLDGSTRFTRYMHTLGWGYHLYKLHCPMAWEITRGKPSIHVIGKDYFDETASTNSDIIPNFLQMVLSSPGSGQQLVGLGKITSPLKAGHGHGCLSEAIATEGAGSMIGTCPRCSGIAIDNRLNTKPYEVDVANGAGGKITVPEVQWCSSGSLSLSKGPDGYDDFTRAISKGMVICSAAGNALDCKGCGQNNNHETDPSNSAKTLLYQEALRVYGGASFISGGTDPFKDVHPLMVGGSKDGDMYGPWGSNPCAKHVGGSVIRSFGNSEFAVDFNYVPYNFSAGLDKFSTATSEATRIERKHWAFQDVVAPAVLVLISGLPTVPEVETTDGTSYSAPMIAGVVGLMRSVSYFLGTEPSDKADVQRRSNNILSLTADKFQDFDNIGNFTYDNSKVIPKGFPASGDNAYTRKWLDPQAAGHSWQYNYVNAGNSDPLQRSWAQRAGFGQVNAYRAVAQAIPLKGDLIYTSSGDLPFSSTCINENTKKLMHFGAYRIQHNATNPPNYTSSNTSSLRVLDSGGVQIPNQPGAGWMHYNQGQTFLKGSSQVALNVPNDCILAIDGLLIGQGGVNHKITTSGNGKILATGYLQDVELTGDSVKVDDLIVYSDNTSGYSKVNVSTGATDEVYGIVQLENHGKFVVNGGTLIVRPGGEIHMDGSEDFEIVSGTVKMEASSRIASSARQVIVDGGANLIIEGLLPVDINCKLYVKTNGHVTINEKAHLRLDEFYIEKNGELICSAGGRLSLNKQAYNQCFGRIAFNGVDGNRAMLTGRVSTCGYVDQTSGIHVQGIMSPSEWDKSHITMTYTDDSSVAIEAFDVKKDPFEHDYFSMNSTYNNWKQKMLTVQNSSLWTTSDAMINSVHVNYCRFTDDAVRYAVDGTHPCGMFLIPTSYHNCGGFAANRVYSVNIQQSWFYNLRTGSEVHGCSNVTYDNNHFGVTPDGCKGPVLWGITDYSSSEQFCANDIENTYVGGLFTDNELSGTLFNNIFSNDTSFSIAAHNRGKLDLRGNSVSHYTQLPWPEFGAWSAGSSNIILTDEGTYEFGRNSFDAGSPFSLKTYDLVMGAVNGTLGNFAVACGLNYFGKYSEYHAISLNQLVTLSVKNNDWDRPGTPAFTKFNVTGTGTPQNQSASPSDPTSCDWLTDASSPCTPVTGGGQRNGQWLLLSSTDTTLKSAWQSGHSILSTPSYPNDTRIDAALDEATSASLMDSSDTYLPATLTDLRGIIYDPAVPGNLKSPILMVKGHVHYLLNQIDSAIACYNSVVTNFHQYGDSVYALWELQRLGIADSATDARDSAYDAYIIRVKNDVLAMMDTVASDSSFYAPKRSHGPKELESTEPLTIRIHPNPVSKEALICVDEIPAGEAFFAEVVDAKGAHVATIYDAVPEADLGICYRLDCSQLAAGTYLVRVANSWMGKTVKFVKE